MPQKIKPTPLKHCASCQLKLERKRYNGVLESNLAFRRRKYCDQACMAAGQEGVIKTLNATNSRRQAQKTVKPQCEMCSRMGRLHVHHRDENPMNNDPSNLQTLCGSCHRLSHSPNCMGTPLQRKPCAHCSRPTAQRGLCWTHLTRFRKYGDAMMTKVKTGQYTYELRRVAS